MPYIVKKGKKKNDFLIVNQKTRQVVGHSTTIEKAYRSIEYREDAEKKTRANI